MDYWELLHTQTGALHSIGCPTCHASASTVFHHVLVFTRHSHQKTHLARDSCHVAMDDEISTGDRFIRCQPLTLGQIRRAPPSATGGQPAPRRRGVLVSTAVWVLGIPLTNVLLYFKKKIFKNGCFAPPEWGLRYELLMLPSKYPLHNYAHLSTRVAHLPLPISSEHLALH